MCAILAWCWVALCAILAWCWVALCAILAWCWVALCATLTKSSTISSVWPSWVGVKPSMGVWLQRGLGPEAVLELGPEAVLELGLL